MHVVHFIIFFLMSLMASYTIIVGRRSDARAAIAAMLPYQGAVGILGLTFGLVTFVSFLADTASLGLIGLVTIIVEIVLGFLLSYGLLSKFVLNRQADDKAAAVKAKLATYEAPLGVLGIALSALWLIRMF